MLGSGLLPQVKEEKKNKIKNAVFKEYLIKSN